MTNARIESRLQAYKVARRQSRQRFFGHVGAFIIVNVLLWVIWAVSGAGLPWPGVITVLWGVVLYVHYRRYSESFGPGRLLSDEELRDLIVREMEREREQYYAEERRDIYAYDQEEVPRIRFKETGEETDSFIRDVKDFQKHRKK